MRKVTRETIRAFLAGKSRSVGNTSTDGTTLKLHGKVIAERRDGNVYVTLAGWGSSTTRERLNGLCKLLGLGHMFRQKQFQQFYGDRHILSTEWVLLEVKDV